ncbi:MAG TPA: hypothetical protein PLM00_02440 [Spirochaetota bacterium]|nr:hypothetical protein [Spirochaetota bacterium]HPN82219.1 hypothetical protein [Spirochaetota bacterium]
MHDRVAFLNAVSRVPIMLVWVCLVCVLFLYPASAVAKDPGLADRTMSADGDRTSVPILQWMREVTGDRSAIVLITSADLRQILLQRDWRKGQRIDDVIRGSELLTSRFIVHYEYGFYTLVSRRAEEITRGKEYREVLESEPSGLALELAGGLWVPGLVPMEQPGASFSIGLSMQIAGAWLASQLRFDVGTVGLEPVDATQYGFSAMLRWFPCASPVLDPYLMAGVQWSLLHESTGGSPLVWGTSDSAIRGGPGLIAGVGLPLTVFLWVAAV